MRALLEMWTHLAIRWVVGHNALILSQEGLSMSGKTPVSSDRGVSEDRESESSAGDATAALGPAPLPSAPSAASGATTDRMTAIDVEKPDADGDDGTTRVTATFRRACTDGYAKGRVRCRQAGGGGLRCLDDGGVNVKRNACISSLALSA